MQKLPLILSATLLVASASQSTWAAKVTSFQSPIAEETFQTEIVNRALAELGHDVGSINEVSYSVGYQQIAQEAESDDISFIAVNWDPLHNAMYKIRR